MVSPRRLILVLVLLLVPVRAYAANMCTISGQVVNADGTPDANDTITINPNPITQIIQGVTITARPVSVQTDSNGNLVALSLQQGLAVLVTLHNQSAAAIGTYVPFTTTSSFSNFISATLQGSSTPQTAGVGGFLSTGSIVITPLGTPAAPTVQVQTTGSTSYTYFCVSRDINNAETIPSSGTTVANGNATVNNVVTCSGSSTVQSFRILKTNTSTSMGICTATGGTCSITDVGQATVAYTPNTQDVTGTVLLTNNEPIFEQDNGAIYRALMYLDPSNIEQLGFGVGSINANTTLTTSTGIGMTIGKGGCLQVKGSASGTGTLCVPAAAGTPAFNLPTTNGLSGQTLATDGAGNTSWGGPTGMLFSSIDFAPTNPATGRFLSAFKAARALIVDNCTASWNGWTNCNPFPIYVMQDLTSATTLCTKTLDSVGGSGINVTPSNTAIASGDVISFQVGTGSTNCNQAAAVASAAMSISYH